MTVFTRRAAIKGAALAAGAAAMVSTAIAQQATQTTGQQAKPKSKKIAIVLFPHFEALDVYGPVEMWGRLPDHEVMMVAERAGPVPSVQIVETVAQYSFETAPQFDVLMIPGGFGARTQVDNPAMLAFLRKQDKATTWTTSVCTGSAVLAKAGLLKGRKATSNKRAFEWVASQDRDVLWQGRARWVVDGKYVTSSGVSAGTDMALSLVEMIYGRNQAEQAMVEAEYDWNDDPHNDPFAIS